MIAVVMRRRRRRATTVVELDPDQVVRWEWWLAAHGWPEGWS